MINFPSHIHPAERLGKKLRHLLQWLGFVWHHRGIPPAIVVYPDAPSRKSALYRMSHHLKLELTNQPRKRAALHIRFEDATEKATQRPAWWPSNAWNERCDDIRKSTLDREHFEVFGYGLALDPTTHAGPMLEKGDDNALHDGRELQGPLSPEALRPGKVHQRIVNNRSSDGRPLDLRLVFIQGQFPTVYLKYKPEDSRYTNETSSVELGEVQSHFDQEECAAICSLMKRLHVDYAELDVLRDRDSGQLFVVDVNPTPWGPPVGLSPAEAQHAIAAAAEVLQACAVSSK
jgi:hypothetical protein